MHRDALLKAIKIIGSQSELAKQLHISRKRLNNWLNRDKTIPSHFALEIEVITQGEVTSLELAPLLSNNKRLSKVDTSSPNSIDDLMRFMMHMHEELKDEIRKIYHFVELATCHHSLSSYQKSKKKSM